MTRMEKRISEILQTYSPKDRSVTVMELVSMFRIYLEQRDQAQWGQVFDGVGKSMSRAKWFDYAEFDKEIEE